MIDIIICGNNVKTASDDRRSAIHKGDIAANAQLQLYDMIKYKVMPLRVANNNILQ